MWTITAPRCPINEHLGSIYRVLNSCHYNIRNGTVQLPHPKTQLSCGHYSLSIFTTISMPEQSGLDMCLLLGRLYSRGPLETCDPRNDLLIPRGPPLGWMLAGPPAELELRC
jgi:hypothetical protein